MYFAKIAVVGLYNIFNIKRIKFFAMEVRLSGFVALSCASEIVRHNLERKNSRFGKSLAHTT